MSRKRFRSDPCSEVDPEEPATDDESTTEMDVVWRSPPSPPNAEALLEDFESLAADPTSMAQFFAEYRLTGADRDTLLARCLNLFERCVPGDGPVIMRRLWDTGNDLRFAMYLWASAAPMPRVGEPAVIRLRPGSAEWRPALATREMRALTATKLWLPRRTTLQFADIYDEYSGRPKSLRLKASRVWVIVDDETNPVGMLALSKDVSRDASARFHWVRYATQQACVAFSRSQHWTDVEKVLRGTKAMALVPGPGDAFYDDADAYKQAVAEVVRAPGGDDCEGD